MLRLFITLYPEKNPVRRSEYAECLRRNLENAEISEICVLAESDGVELLNSPKLKIRKIDRRPDYMDFFQWIEEIAGDDDISVVANSDIWFDAQLGLFRCWRMPAQTVFALARWEPGAHGTFRVRDRNDSQDCWMLRGIPAGVYGNFPLGVARCDNRIAAEFEKAGYRVRNPSFSLQSVHVHDSPPRMYLEAHHSQVVPPPYLYVWPENLWCWPRVVLHNFRYPEARLAYRFDSRRWSPARLMRAVRFNLGALRIKLLRILGWGKGAAG
jgi:hypothetical protein